MYIENLCMMVGMEQYGGYWRLYLREPSQSPCLRQHIQRGCRYTAAACWRKECGGI